MQTLPGPCSFLRLDEALSFTNSQYVESSVLENLAQRSDVLCLLLDFKAVSEVDFTGLEMLEKLLDDLHGANIGVALAEVNEPVFRRLTDAGLVKRIGEDHLFFTAVDATETLGERYRQAKGPE